MRGFGELSQVITIFHNISLETAGAKILLCQIEQSSTKTQPNVSFRTHK